MQALDPSKSKLNIPQKEVDVAAAYAAAMISLPEILGDIAGSMSVIALYFEKKGIAENLFKESDLETGSGN
jgi:hypothetical protein